MTENVPGEWQDDLKHGWGMFKWKDGSSYEGAWADDKMSGRGTFKEANGRQLRHHAVTAIHNVLSVGIVSRSISLPTAQTQTHMAAHIGAVGTDSIGVASQELPRRVPSRPIHSSPRQPRARRANRPGWGCDLQRSREGGGSSEDSENSTLEESEETSQSEKEGDGGQLREKGAMLACNP